MGRPPVPRHVPAPEAIQAGVFGVDLDGPLRPNAEEVRAITEEQAQELVCLRLDMDYLAWCERTESDLATSRRPTTRKRREVLPTQLQHALVRTLRQYRDCLAAYADAFGSIASDELEYYVQAVAAALAPERDAAVQQRLF
ncbi:MAG: hypothetical protein R3C10_28165 [Pirellulales bacterium]